MKNNGLLELYSWQCYQHIALLMTLLLRLTRSLKTNFMPTLRD